MINHQSFEKDELQLEIARRLAFKYSMKMFLKLVYISEEFNIDINSPILALNQMLAMSPLCAAVLLNFNEDTISIILNYPKFDSRKSDIIRNSRSLMNLKYDFDCKHDHLIDEKIKEDGSSCLIDSKITNNLINFLLDHGVDPNIPDKDGVYTLLKKKKKFTFS